MNKKIILDNKYELGTHLGCWARSRERGVKDGDLRVIGGKLMTARFLTPHSGFFWMFVVYDVEWIPADKDATEYTLIDLKNWKLKGLVDETK